MAAGRKTGGRTRETPNRKTAEKMAAIEASGLTPLDYLLSVMREETADRAERMEAAKAAAPYVHPKLSAIDANVSHGLSHEDALAELMGEIATKGRKTTDAIHKAVSV